MEDLLKQIDEKYGPQFKELTEKAAELGEALGEAGSKEQREELTNKINSIDATVKELAAARESELAEIEQKAIKGRVESLETALKSLQDPADRGRFSLGSVTEEDQKAIYGEDRSFFVDAANAKSDPEARGRWEEALGEKAMTSAQGTTGGYLVPAQVSNELIQLREQNNVLRGLFSSISVNSDTLRIAAVTKGLLAGWVAELAEKPASELAFGEISVNTFTKAGMAVVSNQLLRDSNPSVDRLIYNDLAKRLAALEEIAFLDGSGVGQPLGILNTPGVGTQEITSTDIDVLLDAIIDAITDIYTDYFGAPNAIVLHPRTWARIIKSRKAVESTEWAYGGVDRTSSDPLPGYGAGANPIGRLFGLPVYTTRNVPINKGAAGNQSRVVVGNFSEGLVLDHDSITLASSEHVYFTTNQTIFRAEDQVGFTAARYPKAFSVVGGTGLADG